MMELTVWCRHIDFWATWTSESYENEVDLMTKEWKFYEYIAETGLRNNVQDEYPKMIW